MNNRAKYKILFLDDNGYNIESLQTLGFSQVFKKYEFVNMSDLQAYDIIFCDINGVAEEIDSEYQGAALAKDIKDNYPNKIVVIYSANDQSPSFNEFYRCVDDVIIKNISVYKMAEKLDIYIKKISDPSLVWKSLKSNFESKGITTKNLAILEHLYVESIIKKKNLILDANSYLEKEKNWVSNASSITSMILQALSLYFQVK